MRFPIAETFTQGHELAPDRSRARRRAVADALRYAAAMVGSWFRSLEARTALRRREGDDG